MATRKSSSRTPARSSSRVPDRTRTGPAPASSSVHVSPEVARSLIGLSLLVVGAIILIGLMLPGQGKLTDVLRNFIAPFFGSGRWALPFLLIGVGWYVEWGPGARPRSG